MSGLSTGKASVVINRPPTDVWAAVSDITRMGEWSPECTAGRWVGGATGPTAGAKFEGDNVAKVAGRTVKKWTTTSEVTTSEPGKTFTFVAEGYTTWRYTFEPMGAGTRVTETFSFTPAGVQGFIYGKLLRRGSAMQKGMQRTLDRMKAALETSSR
jgi:uncharacterized protein YndB with AHSA1/START domain